MMTGLMRALAENVRRLRRSHTPKLSQQALADRAGVHRNTIANLENQALKSVDLETVTAIADALGAPVEELIAPADDPDRAAVQASLDHFLASELGRDVTKFEATRLAGVGWRWGVPTIATWHALLLALREHERSK